MKTSNRIAFGILLAAALVLALLVVPAQAREITNLPGAAFSARVTGELSVSLQGAGKSGATTVTVYDLLGNTVKETTTRAASVRFTGLRPGTYYVDAFVEQPLTQTGMNAVVEPSKTAEVALNLATTAAPAKVFSGCSAVSGDGNQLKISGGWGVNVVYRQCGRIVAEYGSPGCSCGGNWRYTYDCVKPKTITVNLPCHRGRP